MSIKNCVQSDKYTMDVIEVKVVHSILYVLINDEMIEWHVPT